MKCLSSIFSSLLAVLVAGALLLAVSPAQAAGLK
jgi:hypothetical protein